MGPSSAYQGPSTPVRFLSAAKKPPRARAKRLRDASLRREVAYLYDDESEAVERMAEEARCSKSEIIQRAVRLLMKQHHLRAEDERG